MLMHLFFTIEFFIDVAVCYTFYCSRLANPLMVESINVLEYGLEIFPSAFKVHFCIEQLGDLIQFSESLL